MGKHVDKRYFDKADYEEFRQRLKEEQQLLQTWHHDRVLAEYEKQSGFELECWLLNDDYSPANNNLSFIDDVQDKHLISEAAKSCLEINLPTDTLHNHALGRHEDRLNHLLASYRSKANETKQHIIAIGTLPTAKSEDFTDLTLTDENRYHAINARLAALREHRTPILHIIGHDSLVLPIDSFALVGAISSFQVHFRIGIVKSARFYNASLALSACTVALSANSPYLFGHDLWAESRIPFYEQILLTTSPGDLLPRVTFGPRYLTESLLELFSENMRYTPFLPQLFDEPIEKMAHLRLHNGNIYRWNRPVLDFDQHHHPYLRIEHRPLSAGPTVIDMIANAAFYFGITHFYTTKKEPIEHEISFYVAKDNFYRAAKYGLSAEITWFNHKKIIISDLILNYLLPQAKEGLMQLDLDPVHINHYLAVIEERIKKNKPGYLWQRTFFHHNGCNHTALTKAYLELQSKGDPVHEWPTE